jgi:hypothetical protein
MSSGPLAVSSKSDFIGYSFAVRLNSGTPPIAITKARLPRDVLLGF